MSIRLGLALLLLGCGGSPAAHTTPSNHRASGIPNGFVEAVEHRIAADNLHVTDWWADDLDGDKVDEAIAMVCNDEHGLFLVMHGSELLEAPLEVDGRNACPPPSRPDWTRHTDGKVTQHVGVHHGSMTYSYALRDGKIVLVASSSSGFDVNRDGSRDSEELSVDYDQLTYTQVRDPGETTEGVVVLAAEHPHRTTTVVGKTTLRASKSGDKVMLHVHADRPLAISDCQGGPTAPCTPTKIGAGDHDVPVDPVDLTIVAGATYHVHVETLDDDAAYPSPPKPW